MIPSLWVFPAVAAVTLGLVGLACGFYGPIVLDPGANQGPLLGIFITGLLGGVLGLAVGFAAAVLQLRARAFCLTLLASSAVWGGVTLYATFPQSRYQGLIIDAEVRSCDVATAHVPEAIARWQRSNTADASWRSPRSGWMEDVPRMLQDDRGVVLTMLVHRKSEVYEQRKPWNRGRLSATTWDAPARLERHYARFGGGSCEGYVIGARRLFSPQWEASSVSPPDILPTLLGLHVLQEVPPAFRGLSGT